MHYNVYVLGTACVDHTVFAGDLSEIFDASRGVLDGKRNAIKSYVQPGGSALNTDFALRHIGKYTGDNVTTYVCARFGQECGNKQMILEDLRHTGFGDPRIMDMAYEQQYWVPSNLILPNKHNDNSGRAIQRLGAENGRPNSEEISPTIGREIENLFQSTERKIHAAILHSRDPEIALQAAKNAKNQGSLISLDYSETDPKLVNHPAMHELLCLGDYLFVDSDAVLPGMDGKNPDKLFIRLRDEYQKRFFALSNSSKAIRAYADGQDSILSVMSVVALDPNGAGDVRTAATTLFLLKGQPFLMALKQGSNFASHSVAHYGREWAATLEDVHTNLLIRSTNGNLNGHNGNNFPSPFIPVLC